MAHQQVDAMLFYPLNQSPEFADQLRRLPKQHRYQVLDDVQGLTISPLPDGKNKIKLEQYKNNIFRLKSGNYRVYYSFDKEGVYVLDVDLRRDAYKDERIDLDKDGFDPTKLKELTQSLKDESRQVDSVDRSEGGAITQEAETESDVSPAQESFASSTESGRKLSGEAPPPRELPQRLDRGFLRTLEIPQTYIPALCNCRSEDDLIEAPVPGEIVTKVIDAVWAPNYDDVIQGPMFAVDSIEDLRRYADGDLVTFLLRLDSEQESYVNWAIRGAGPNLLKGGAGTGKSIVAIYRTRAIIRELRKIGITQPRILFTSYTNALVNTSRQLLERLLGSDIDCVTTITADGLVSDILKSAGLRGGGADDAILRYETETARGAFADGSVEDKLLAAAIAHLSADYLSEEIDSVIFGRELDSLEDYLRADRSGRRVRLSQNQRRAIWRLAEIRQQRLARKNQRTFAENRRRALDIVRAGEGPDLFDAVIIDEAQDLDPTVIRLLVRLCKSPDRLFLTADANQSIYGSGFRWADVHDDLRFRGRTGVLRRNYRSTKQIGVAAESFLAGAELDMEEGTGGTIAYVRDGTAPIVFKWRSFDEELEALHTFLRLATRSVRVGLGACAVLVPDKGSGDIIVSGLKQRDLKARFMPSQDVNLEEPVIKVLTMHAAKGLEFPIVAVGGFKAQGHFLKRSNGDSDEEAEEINLKRRVVHVAMTRAMRELLVLVPADCDSPILAGLDELCWMVDEVIDGDVL